MVNCTSKTRVVCTLHTYTPDCDPRFVTRDFPSLFGDVDDVPDIPLNFRSKVVANNGTVGILLIWQQYIRSNPSIVQGFQLSMKGRDGVDFGNGRCFILQIQNHSSPFDNAFETFYLIVNNVLPKSSYTFKLHSLPRFNPFLSYRTIQTEVNTDNYIGSYPDYPSNWEQSIECIFNEETQSVDIFIEVASRKFGLTLFEVNIFDNVLQEIGVIAVNSSDFGVLHDQPNVFPNGYILMSHKIRQKLNFLEVWVTPIDQFHYIPSKCLCYTGNRYCSPCRTATTKCAIGRDIIEVLAHNLTTQTPEDKTMGRSDLIAWLCVCFGIISASICAFIVFKKQHELCKACTNNESRVPLETTHQCVINEPTCSITAGSFPDIDIDETNQISGKTSAAHSQSSSNDESYPLVDSCSLSQSNGNTDEMNVMIETYFSFIPPESQIVLSRTLSDQMIDINRKFLPESGSNLEHACKEN